LAGKERDGGWAVLKLERLAERVVNAIRNCPYVYDGDAELYRFLLNHGGCESCGRYVSIEELFHGEDKGISCCTYCLEEKPKDEARELPTGSLYGEHAAARVDAIRTAVANHTADIATLEKLYNKMRSSNIEAHAFLGGRINALAAQVEYLQSRVKEIPNDS